MKYVMAVYAEGHLEVPLVVLRGLTTEDVMLMYGAFVKAHSTEAVEEFEQRIRIQGINGHSLTLKEMTNKDSAK